MHEKIDLMTDVHASPVPSARAEHGAPPGHSVSMRDVDTRVTRVRSSSRRSDDPLCGSDGARTRLPSFVGAARP